jgi:type IV fimbrial biogenesis protein FimT
MADMGRKQQGLTLIELMVTLAVAIILITVGMPMFTGVVANNRATTQTNALVSAVKLARSEAVKRGANVSIAATSSDWANGWTVFVDANSDGNVDVGEGLRSWDELTGADVGGVAGTAVVIFGRNGASNANYNFDLTRSDGSGPLSRCITISLSGQVRMKKQKAGEAWSCP